MRRRIGICLLVIGTATLAWVAVTIAWGDPITSLYTAHEQHVLATKLGVTEKRWTRETGVVREPAKARKLANVSTTLVSASVLARAHRFARTLHDGDPIGRIVIPKIGLNMIVVQGTSESDLSKGPGHYDVDSGWNTQLPGGGKVVAIAGHRTTFLHPFRHIDEVRPGDNIYLEMPYGTFRYEVYYQKIVTPTDWTILRPRAYEKLVLSACHPLYSASHRIVTFARLRGVSSKSAL